MHAPPGRRDIWYDRAKSERDDLDREVRMLDEAMKIIRGHKDVATLPQVGSRWAGEGELVMRASPTPN